MSHTSDREVLLDHFRHPRNRGEVVGMQRVARGSNHRCGDEVEVGIEVCDDTIATARFQGRGCSICIASASIMTEVVVARPVAEARQCAQRLREWLHAESAATLPLPELPLAALAAIRPQASRLRCALLAWDALEAALRSQPQSVDTPAGPV